MRRALRAALKAVGVVIGVAILAVFATLAFPSWILNTKTLSSAIRSFGRSYRPAWRELDFRVRSPGLRTKRVVFHAADFCLDETQGAMKGCFQALDLDATLRLGVSPLVSVRRLETLRVHAGPLTVDERVSASAKKKKKKAKGSNLSLVPRPLRRMTVGCIDVKISSAEVISTTGTMTASIAADFSDKTEKPLTAELFAVQRGSAPGMVQKTTADLVFDTDLFRSGHVTHLDARARLKTAEATAELTARARQPRKDVLALTAFAKAKVSGRTVDAELAGEFSNERASATASVLVEDPAGPVRKAGLPLCRFDAPLGKSGPTSADLKCSILVAPAPFGTPRPKKENELTGSIDAYADFKRKGLQSDHFDATVKAEIGPAAKRYGFFARLNLRLAGRTGSIPAGLKARHEFETGFNIAKFQDLVDALDGTRFAIPAPIDALKGRVTFDAKASGEITGPSQKLDYEAVTELSSAKQKLNTRTRGRVTIEDLFSPDRKTRDETDVELQDVAIQLPYLKLGPMPSPVADTRIKTGNPKRDAAVEARRREVKTSSAAASSVDYVVRVKTKKPLTLLSNLIEAPVPISLDLRAAPAGPSGTIRIESFDLDVFRQKARVDHLTLSPQPSGASMPVDGKVVYKRQDATVDILILGAVDKPQIAFQSTPPMTQNEIVAMLLYGKSPTELDADQQATAGTASSAFTDGAFGLASLFLFASTPVDSVSYDPATQTYEVKFKLPGGATFGVGSNLEESKTLTLRKRVARNVELETEVRQGQAQAQRNAVTTFLEYFRRY